MSIKYELAIDCGNAAFDYGNIGNELARILRKEADRLEMDGMVMQEVKQSSTIRDINGNKVGAAEFVSEKAADELSDAFRVVLDLATENIIDDIECEDEHARQVKAIDVVAAHHKKLRS